MITAFLIVLVIMFILISSATLKAINLNGKDYFKDASYDENKYPEAGFYIKKHTIFRFFALLYEVIHYVLQVISITSTSITLYMIMDSSVSISVQIFFFLFASISTNLVIGFRLDKLAECYANAMRIMENAILKYLLEANKDINILYEANKKAEEYISNKFF